MLSLFPRLLDFSVITISVLRIVTGIFFLWEGYIALKKNKCPVIEVITPEKRKWCKTPIGTISVIGGVFLSIGLFTQITAIVLAVVSIINGFAKRHENPAQTIPYYLLLFFVSLAFLFLGPGTWGLDFPL